MTLALIHDGFVTQISDVGFAIHPDLVWIDITGMEPAPQAGWTVTENQFGRTFAPPPAQEMPPPTPSIIMQASAALSVGLSIVSIGNSDVNGSYSVAPDAQAKLTSTAAFCSINGRFPGGKATLSWPDINGTAKAFLTIGSFIAFATAIGDYVAILDDILIGESQILPPPNVTIA